MEDDEFKRRKIFDFLTQELQWKNVSVAASVSSATDLIDEIDAGALFLDMAIPNYDDGTDGAQGLGGVAVFRYARMVRVHMPVIVITQFEALEQGSRVVDIGTLRSLLNDEFGSQFLGLVQYRPNSDDWKESIKKMLSENGL
ncbi:hypothetical protein [Herbaspirillum sp.]|uniref:hypothetical protein n=1 Tax=Herbaspirillum sp. TaxID=1890675 RepID=UPI001B019576|nr:hypothetical protein [Herbaspirillum sp.]MBO9537347.1 hypothetical protein [Herbaspirillum sp.]